MAEYISREAAIEKLNKLCNRVCKYSKSQRKYMCGACPLGDAFTVIEDDIPAADVRPVVRAKWEISKENGDIYPHMNCSACGFYWREAGHRKHFKFCPNCGADMREET